MLVECGLLLREAGLDVRGVISDHPAVVEWAGTLRLPVIGHDADVVAWLARAPFDYLLSIFNLAILPEEVLRLPRIAAINCHDGPLPRYAGLHASSWAILHAEKRWAVTWHLMEPAIDTGAIVRQRWFDVGADDTALSLNLKCFKAGLDALAEMIPDLSAGTIAATPQDLAQRTYYAGSRRPAAAGIIDWSGPGEQGEALARAMDFGPYFNPLVLPKIWTGEECLLVSRVGLGEPARSAPPGTVLAVDDGALTIATASRPVTVAGLATIDGEPLSVAEAARRFQLHVGRVLPLLGPARSERLTSLSEAVSRHERYWTERLLSLEPVVPVRVPRAVHAREWVARAWRVPEEVAASPDRRSPRCTQGEWLLAAIGAFLARWSGRERFDVEFRAPGTPPVDPCHVFAEHVPFRFEIDVDDDFAGVLSRVRTELDHVSRRQTYPRDLVSRSPTLRGQAGLTAGNKLSVAVELGCVGSVADRGYDLVLQVPLDGRDGLVMFDAACHGAMETPAERLSLFLGNLAGHEGEPLRAISIVSPAERQTLLGTWRSTGEADRSQECLHDLVASQAARTPAAVAVRCGEVELTYRELDARAGQLARRLRRLGVRPEVAVGLCVERSPEAVVGMLGILKAGGAYVPLDPAYPSNRLAFIVGDSGMRAVVTTRGLAGRLPAGPMPRVYLDADEPVDAVDASADPVTVEHRNLAYVIYTSGSSGTPKGVMVEHRSVVNFVRAAQARYALRSADRVLQFASMNFDASVEEIFPCLASGATLVLRTDDMLSSARVFMGHCAEWGITVLDLPTAYWHVLVTQMQDGGVSPHAGLRLVIIGGEAAAPTDVAAWRALVGRRIELVNTYGPTEATVVSTWADLNACADAPIGVPIPGATVCVLDRGGQLVPAGVVGELHIGGAGLARGYRNRPELTAEKFVPDPHDAVPGGRLYRTGDLCSWRPDGMLAFHGRLDAQVKVRGHRIELGEIEAAIAGVPEVRQAAVIAHEVKPGDTRLVAYYVGGSGGVGEAAVRDHLARVLPESMMPAAFVRLESLPLNRSGKIDRKALPALHRQRSLPAPGVLPRTPLERRIAGAWCALLGVDSVGVHDDFFHSGGNSLVAMELVAAIRDTCGVEVPLSRLFERRTIAEQAAFIAASTVDGDDASAPPPVSVADAGPPSLAADGRLELPAAASQQGMWLLRSLCADPATYNESFVFRTRAAVDWQRLRRALATIMAGQPALRTSLALGDRGVVQRIEPAACVALPWAERTLAVDRGVDREEAIGALLREEARRPFDLSIAPLWRATLVRVVDGESLLQFAFHHAIIDDWSTRLLIDWLAEGAATADPAGAGPGVATIAAGVVAPPPLSGPEAARHRDFWAAALRDPPDGPRWPAAHARPSAPTGRGDVLAFDVDADTARRLRGLAHENDVTLFVLMLAAWHAWLHLASGEDDVVVGTPVADRVRPETQRALGCFLNTLPIRVRWRDVGGDRPADARPAGPSFREVVGAVRDTFHAALAHVELPFEQIVGTAAECRAGNVQPLVRVLFAFVDRPLPALRVDGLALPLTPVHTGTSKCDLTLFVVAEAGAFRCRLEYATDVFDAATIGAHAARFVAFLEAAAAAPETPVAALPIDVPEKRAAPAGRGPVVPLPQPTCLVDLFCAQARRTPAAVAVACADREISYAELDAASDRLAARLGARLSPAAVEPGGFIGILLDRSIEFVVAVLGVLKAGAGYAPLPADQPAERLAFMVADARLPAVVTRRRLAGRLPADGAELVFVDADEPWWHRDAGAVECGPPAGRGDGESPAYVMYTSGSTGTPKGVVVPHRAVVRLVHGQTYAAFGPGLRTLLLAPTAFDASTFELWAPLLGGGTCVVFPDPIPELPRLAEVLRAGRVNCLWLTAGLFNHVVDAAPEVLATVPHVITGGESLSIPHVRRALAALPGLRLTNGYGPTEATTFATTHEIDRDDTFPGGTVPIGRPLANTTCLVVDAEMRPLPSGRPGELVIGGPGLARGYLGWPELTAERFIPDPRGEADADRLYRTGDLCRWRSDGVLEFLGRIDDQVKIRGHRVEPGEVQAVLERHPGVEKAAVVVREREMADGSVWRILRGCVVPRPGATVDAVGLRAFLAGRLPVPMLPGEWVVRPDLPLSPNGKVDRATLLALPADAVHGQGDDAADACTADEARLGTLLEAEIMGIWRRLFGRDDIRRDDDFFAIGGHSLLAARLAVELERLLGHPVAIASLFQAPTVESQARLIADASWAPPWKSLVPIAPAGDRPPLFFVHGVGGDVFHFVRLAKLLPADQPVYGLQSIGRDAAAPATLEELAAEYAAEIRSLAPRGPYRVGGYSLGGWLAFEVARRLRVEGDDVTLLLFDVHANCAAPWPARTAQHLAAAIVELGAVAERMRLHVGRLRERPVGGRCRAVPALVRPLVRRLARAAGWSTFDRAAAERTAADRGTPLARPDPLFPLVARHVPAAFDGQIELFLASSWSSAPLPLFWRLLVGRRVRVHRLPCGHHDFFAPERVQTLAGAVTTAIATPGSGAAPASCPNPRGRHA